MTHLIKATNLSVKRGQNILLQEIDLQVRAKEIVTIVGPNGAGKSTLLRTLIGATPFSGTLQLKPRLTIGYVPQKLHLEPSLPLSVKRFLNLPMRQSNKDIADALDAADATNLIGRQLRDLSGGEFQRVLLARALINKPELLILDEATQGLDHLGADSFYRQIEFVRQTIGCAILMVSHELHVVMAASDRVICLNGHICCEGTPEYVASNPAYKELFGIDTNSALALYRHHHDHNHDRDHGTYPDHLHGHGPRHNHNHNHNHNHDHDHDHNHQHDDNHHLETGSRT